jgi:hypothetical protein
MLLPPDYEFPPQTNTISLADLTRVSIVPEHSFSMNFRLRAKTAVVLLVLADAAGLARLPSINFGGAPGAPGADFSTLSRLFAGHTGFTAKSEVRMYDKSHQETIRAAMNFSYLENKIRIEIDVTRMKNKDLPPGIADQLEQMGMDQVVMLIRPDKKSVYAIYPKLAACLSQPLPRENAGAAKMDKQTIGKETLDGYSCVKNKVTFTAEKGGKEELTVWNAPDLKDFPVQILTRQGDETVITRYKQIQLAKPDAKLFDLPSGFKEYSDTQSFMQGITVKILGGGLSETK